MTKKQINKDEKLENIDFDLFGALSAIDKKNYNYFDNLTDEQKKKFSPYMMVKWYSYIQSKNSDLQRYYVISTNEFANKHLFNDTLYDHPKLVYLMLCASSPNSGFVKRQWLPQIKEKVSQLKEPATNKDIRDYYTKVYPNTDKHTIDKVSNLFVKHQNKKVYLAEKFPHMKYEDIEVLANIITDDEIQQYEQEHGK